MHAVAVCELAEDAERAAEQIAPLVRANPYDLRVALSGVLPRVVLQTPDARVANEIARSASALGYGVVACDLADVVAGTDMTRVHRFVFDAAHLWANDGHGERLAWAEIGAVLVVARRVDVVRRTQEGVAVMRGARVPTTEASQRTDHEHVIEHVVYLLPRERSARPWMLHEREVQYRALGSRMRLTRHDNFREALALVRERTPGALFDDRFAVQPRTATQLVHVLGHDAAVPELSDAGVDLIVHVLGEWLLRGCGGPYRRSSAQERV